MKLGKEPNTGQCRANPQQCMIIATPQKQRFSAEKKCIPPASCVGQSGNTKSTLQMVCPTKRIVTSESQQCDQAEMASIETESNAGPHKVTFVTLQTDQAQAKFASFGATLTHFVVDSPVGRKDIVLGFDTPQDYIDLSKTDNFPCFGCIIGRTANRTSNARFSLNGKVYDLGKNCGEHNLHSKPNGMDMAFFETRIPNPEVPAVVFSYISNDGESGFPGTVLFSVTYTLHSEPTSLQMSYEAELLPNATPTPIKTPVNLTNHAYFNLSGMTSETIESHTLHFPNGRVNGFLELAPDHVPTGLTCPLYTIHGFDFSNEKAIGRDFKEPGVRTHSGYDHFFTINPSAISSACSAVASQRIMNMPVVAVLKSPDMTLCMELRTTTPGFQMYTGQGIPNVNAKMEHAELLEGGTYGRCSGVALETSFPPNAVNRESFGWHDGVVIGEGEIWKHETIYT
ncbi:hypothetical protein HK096_011417, partial [Nowakowskiella sp. JEL0078]